MADANWNLKIDLQLEDLSIKLGLTAEEASLLQMLRGYYPAVESQIKRLAQSKRPADLPPGLLDDGLTLIRCLVFNRLEAYRGEHVQIARVA